MKSKTVDESSVLIVQQMTQIDANLAGNVHGGAIMRLIDNTAGIVAVRHASGNVVTASIDRLDFYSPVYIGDLLRINACLNYVGKSSMEIGTRIEAEDFLTGEIRHTASAYLTYVALDSEGNPIHVPQIDLKTEEEKRRYEEAEGRRRMRLKTRQKRKTQN